jgi:hypothetical protein
LRASSSRARRASSGSRPVGNRGRGRALRSSSSSLLLLNRRLRGRRWCGRSRHRCLERPLVDLLQATGELRTKVLAIRRVISGGEVAFSPAPRPGAREVAVPPHRGGPAAPAGHLARAPRARSKATGQPPRQDASRGRSDLAAAPRPQVNHRCRTQAEAAATTAASRRSAPSLAPAATGIGIATSAHQDLRLSCPHT